MLFPFIFLVLILVGVISLVLIRLDTPVTKIIVRLIIAVLVLTIVVTFGLIAYVLWTVKVG